jgi:hypothetical protein
MPANVSLRHLIGSLAAAGGLGFQRGSQLAGQMHGQCHKTRVDPADGKSLRFGPRQAG